MVPNRESLIETGSDDEDGLEAMLSLAKDALKKPRPISGIACGWMGTSGRRGSPIHPIPVPGVPRTATSVHGQAYAERRNCWTNYTRRRRGRVLASYSAFQDNSGNH